MLPAEALLKVFNALTDSAFVETEWEGKHVLVFRIDLRERGDALQSTAESRSKSISHISPPSCHRTGSAVRRNIGRLGRAFLLPELLLGPDAGSCRHSS